MKYLLALFCVALAGSAAATQVAPKSLPELVAQADHVVVASVVAVDLVDGRGRAVDDPAARTGPGLPNRMSFQLRVEEALFARAGAVPPTIRVPLWSMWHYSLGSMRENVVGSRGIFLLKGDAYEPVYPAGFQRSLDERAQIERLLGR